VGQPLQQQHPQASVASCDTATVTKPTGVFSGLLFALVAVEGTDDEKPSLIAIMCVRGDVGVGVSFNYELGD
jgi:hypothetical protein